MPKLQCQTGTALKITINWRAALFGKPKEVSVQYDLEKFRRKYYQTVTFFKAGCLGITKQSRDINFSSWADFEANGQNQNTTPKPEK